MVALLSGCAANFSPTRLLRVDPIPQVLYTSQPLRLSTSLGSEAVAAQWHIVATTNALALGSGSLSSQGVYTAPSILSRDRVTVTLEASADAQSSQTTLVISPAFAQPLQPENATLLPGATLEFRAELAEVTSGTVRWRLVSQAADSGAGSGAELGTLSGQHCTRASNQFTTCTVTYTAPLIAPPNLHVQLIASGPGTAPAQAGARLMLGTLTSNPVLHQQEQRPPIALGSSGSNDNDFDTFADTTGNHFVADCCGGTLGAILEDQAGTPYLLSNNHVLATSDQARWGDPIEHPGLIDDACVPLTHPGAQLRSIGSLRYFVPLAPPASSTGAPPANVDAALATLNPGAVDASDSILELGSESSTPSNGTNTLRAAPPTAGSGEPLDAAHLAELEVAKSGRTTGLTCSAVEAVDLRIVVDYYKDCAETERYTSRTFTGQIAVGGESFADAGDSGALLLDAANAEPIGLLYATATTRDPWTNAGPAKGAGIASAAAASPAAGLTLANPIGDVLTELAAQISPTTRLTVRGSTVPHRLACLNYDPPSTGRAFPDLSPDERARTADAVEAARAFLVNGSLLTVAAGASEDSPGEGAILVVTNRLVPSPASSRAALPEFPPGLPHLDAGSLATAQPEPWSAAPAIPPTIAGVRTVLVATPSTSAEQALPLQPVPQVGLHLSQAQLIAAETIAERLAPALMTTPAIFGVGVAESLDDPAEPALLLLIDADASTLDLMRLLQRFSGANAAAQPALTLPATLGGLRTRYLRMHRFRVTQSKYLAQGSPSLCSVKQDAPGRQVGPR